MLIKPDYTEPIATSKRLRLSRSPYLYSALRLHKTQIIFKKCREAALFKNYLGFTVKS